MEELVVAVRQAIGVLYSNPDPAQKKGADKWLLSIRSSPQAWDLAWRLLQECEPSEVQFYGANLLLMKVALECHT